MSKRDGVIATVVLDHPETMKALSFGIWMRLSEVMRELDADESLRRIVRRGARVKAFLAKQAPQFEGR